ncbi:hypothetical protein DUI87_35262 [Hirundo rustica rustica]|uniref:CCHC-type domain-containing protein n=1 Tax=Hirundo rustica rustica TaxID=333673 RepID=A0A3M0IJ08_HIRRU|nr:hypothetical protein DUI87_35262 [Hirundo rustica rustica]
MRTERAADDASYGKQNSSKYRVAESREGSAERAEVASRELQTPEGSVAGPGACTARTGRSPGHVSIRGQSDSDDENDGADLERQTGWGIPLDSAGPGLAGAGWAVTGRGRGGESLEGTTPRQQGLRSPTPPTSSYDLESPGYRDSGTAAEVLRMGTRPKISQILQAFPELKRYLRTPSPQRTAASVPSSPRGGAERQRARRSSVASTEGSVWEDVPTLHRFFSISYKKSTSSEQRFKQKPREPLPMVRDDDVIDEDHEMSITDEDIIRITASEGIPARRIFLPGKEVSKKFEDAQQALIPVQRVKEKEKVKEKETEKEKEKETEKETKPEEVKPPKQVGPEKEEAAEKAKTKETISEAGTARASAKPEFSPTDWTEIKKFALKGDTLSMDPKGIVMPVTYDAHDANPKWERLDREVVRDLMKAVRDNGLGSPYFKQLLKGTFNIYDLTPFDLQSLATMILSDSQFILWEAKWRKILNDYRIKYQGGANAGFTVAQLAGDPPLDSAACQASFLPRDVLTDIKDAARKAMVQIPPAGVTESLFTDVKQGPSEPFASFIDHLTQAVDRQVIDEGVKSHMIRCLAFANANPECKRVISAMPGQPTMAEILEACSKVGTPQHVAMILGDQVEKAVKEAFANFQQRQCYKCGKPGHFKKDCPQITNNADSSDHCSACGRRKRRPARNNASGGTQSGNSRRSADRQRATTQVMAMTQEQAPQGGQSSGNSILTPSAGQFVGSPAIQSYYHPGRNAIWQLPK